MSPEFYSEEIPCGLILVSDRLPSSTTNRSSDFEWSLPGGGGGDSAYERGGDASRKFVIKPLKETDLGVAQAFLDP